MIVKRFLAHHRQAMTMLLLMTLLLGVVVPFIFTVIAQLVFPSATKGSIITVNDKVIGSELLGQEFNDPKYFWGRPSATTPPYNAASSGASNLSMNNPLLLEQANKRMEKLPADEKIPVSLITTSGSGLDPDISVQAAYFQAPRIAKERKLPLDKVRTLIAEHIDPGYLGFIGTSRVNVLKLNLALDGLNGTDKQ